MLTKNADVKLNVDVQIKAGPEDGLGEGEFIAYASVFNNVDSVGDVVMPGAFTKDLQRWKASGFPIPLLYGHNMSDPEYNIGYVLDAKEDENGLLIHAKIDDLDVNSKSRQSYRIVKGRRLTQMSFAYDEIDSGPAVRDSQDVWELRELKLYEVSIVPIGANQETEILAVKQVPNVAERALRDLKAGRVLSAKNETELRDAHEAIGRVLSALDGTSDEEKASDDGPSRPAPAGDTPEGQQREASRKSSVDASALIDEIDRLQVEFV